jgi:hypothetical protein
VKQEKGEDVQAAAYHLSLYRETLKAVEKVLPPGVDATEGFFPILEKCTQLTLNLFTVLVEELLH